MGRLYKRNIVMSQLEEIPFPEIVDILTDMRHRTAVFKGSEYRHSERFGMNSVASGEVIRLSILYLERGFVDDSSQSVFFIDKKKRVIYRTHNTFALFYDLDKVHSENRFLIDANVEEVVKEFRRKRYCVLDKR